MPFHVQFFADSTQNLIVYTTKKTIVQDALIRLLVTRKCKNRMLPCTLNILILR